MTAKTSILLVDDDAEITELLGEYLTRFNYEVHCASDGPSMREQLRRHNVDLVVLDIMLPGADGLMLAREIRRQTRTPIIMLTARTSTLDRILGLENGADDYMSKPFEPRELVARIQSVLRRSQGPQPEEAVASSEVVVFDGWELHRNLRTLVSPTGLVVALSNAEFRLLNTFLSTPRRLLSRDQLMEQARGRAMDAFERSIDLLVSRLRHKLADDSREVSMIKTIRGAGYMFNVQSVQGRVAWRA
ncbi:response regulator transcription factor [Rhodoferax sp. GW822-FHT02A01]|uniref:response regulator transcription factor n=1 Tax=Rhodoferax sp. GW822-FHT02A01 TaxID=3141537 RepID=UPI00315DE2D9